MSARNTMIWSKSARSEKNDETTKITDAVRNVRFIHMQISTPKVGSKTRASKMKEALMIIFATSKYIKLHPKVEGEGEIITNIEDLVTTEEFTNQYFFDKKIGGKRYIRGEGATEYYVTKVRLETDVSLSQMKWRTSAKFLEALKRQHIYLKEYQDGAIMRTGNIGWIAGLNPTNVSIARTTSELNRVLRDIQATAIVDVHTVSIRFPETKKAFVTRAYKVMSNMDKLEEAREAIKAALTTKKMGVGWENVELVNFNMEKNATAMMIERHNRKLHNTAVIAVKNIWSITEKDTTITDEEMTTLGLDIKANEVSTIEEMWWMLANKYKQDIQGMVVRRGTLEILTTRRNLNDTVGFTRELIHNTIEILGQARFATMTANHNPHERQPILQEAPMILAGKGRVKLDTTHFTEDEFKNFAMKHGIPLDNNSKETKDEKADLTRPPRAFYHKAGREPIEQDPRKMREGASEMWEKFAEKTKVARRKMQEQPQEPTNTQTEEAIEDVNRNMTSFEIKQKGTMIRLENSMKVMKDSQKALETSAMNYQDKIDNMKRNTEESMDKMSEMITKMSESITTQNRQLEAQARTQVKHAEDIERIMKAISVISDALTPTTTQDDNVMQIDIAESNYNKRKQTSLGSTTPFAEEQQESIMTQPKKADRLLKGMHSAGRQ